MLIHRAGFLSLFSLKKRYYLGNDRKPMMTVMWSKILWSFWPPLEYGGVIFLVTSCLTKPHITDCSATLYVLTTWWSGDDNALSGTWGLRIAVFFLMVIRDGDTPLIAVFFPNAKNTFARIQPCFLFFTFAALNWQVWFMLALYL